MEQALRAFLLASVFLAVLTAGASADDMARWKSEAARVTITRDDWGIAHVHGKSDADAVFGMIYAQAEDDFNRIEVNYITNLGRRAETEGMSAIWADLARKMFLDTPFLKARYGASPAWLKAYMNAWADGLNFYLATHPSVHPKVITRFEPWMALSFSEGSIGGDIEKITPAGLEAFYGKQKQAYAAPVDRSFREPVGSNGIAISPKLTRDGHALLLINPHTSFFFRSEMEVSSDVTPAVYGAATWGQFFLYQGFNEHAGWMHTSTTADAVDEFAETVTQKNGRYFYKYGTALRPVTTRIIALAYRTADGAMASRKVTAYFTHHGPIVRQVDGKWIAFAMMNKPVEALEQAVLRTKQKGYGGWLRMADFHANSSNNTVFADDSGAIAYLHPQFVPKRDDSFDYTKPVDGSDPKTDWHGVHAVLDVPHLLDPASGWLFNTNDGPWNAAGKGSLDRSAFPKYMDTLGENPRGVHAQEILPGAKDITLESLLRLAFDSHLPEFEILIPRLAAAWDGLADSDPLKAKLKDQVAALKGWDRRWGADSVETSLAVFFGETLWNDNMAAARAAGVTQYKFIEALATPAQQLAALAAASDRLTADFGSWKTPWGQINRFQRVTDDIAPKFDDALPSIPVPFTSSQWGSLASFGAKRYPGTKKYYGNTGNSFVAVVEFGPKVKALAITAGGESGDPKSPHFNDEATRYASGNFRPVYFYPEDLKGHVERVYKPGE
jgi:acyl-homoserine-lactone acylase